MLTTDPLAGHYFHELDFGPETVLGSRYKVKTHVEFNDLGLLVDAFDSLRAARGEESDCLIKIIDERFLTDGLIADRFVSGLFSIAKLRHPNIEKISLDGSSAGVLRGAAGPFLLHSDLGNGRSLRSFLTEHDGPIQDFPFLLTLLRQVALGLEAAHAEGIVHCHLKPRNVWCERSGAIRVINFGRCDTRKHKLKQHSVGPAELMIGDVAYLAPEVPVIGQHLCDERADIYSFGKLAFRLTTGVSADRALHYPFNVFNVVSSDLPACSKFGVKVPAWLEFLIYKSTRPRIRDRFQSMKEIVNIIDEHFDSESGKIKDKGLSDLVKYRRSFLSRRSPMSKTDKSTLVNYPSRHFDLMTDLLVRKPELRAAFRPELERYQRNPLFRYPRIRALLKRIRLVQ